MKLRVRLIVAFLLLSVVPLGAATIYAYVTNRQALEDAATREADELDRQLSERMTLVTTELSCVETESEADEMFGAERLESVLASCRGVGTDEVLKRVEQQLARFRGSREPFDDATTMAVRIA